MPLKLSLNLPERPAKIIITIITDDGNPIRNAMLKKNKARDWPKQEKPTKTTSKASKKKKEHFSRVSDMTNAAILHMFTWE